MSWDEQVVAPARQRGMPDHFPPTKPAAFRVVFEAASNAMLLFNDEPRVVFANAAACVLLVTSGAGSAGESGAFAFTPESGLDGDRWRGIIETGHGCVHITTAGYRDTDLVLRVLGNRKDATRLVSVEQIGLPGAGVLTGRQRDTVRLLCDGATNQQIAIALGVSDPTVQKHVVGIKERIGAANRAQVVALMLQREDFARRAGSERLHVHQVIRNARGEIVDTRLLYVDHATRRDAPAIISRMGQRVGSWSPDHSRSPLLALIGRAVDSGRPAYADRVAVGRQWGGHSHEIDTLAKPVGADRAMYIGRLPIASPDRGGSAPTR
ncbi:MAG: LuxR C-terminal-related transcriptional regulator [Gaiellales bacterium]